MTIHAAPRSPWPIGFPDVIVHTDVRTRDAHSHYAAAKAGDADAALVLAEALMNAVAKADLRSAIGERQPLLLPVVAEETAGFNAIPDAMALILGRNLDLQVVSGEIVQINKVGHTRARAFQRLVTPAEFGGAVMQGADYVLVDDHVGLGGTLANLRGYVEAGGGRIIAVTTLTESRNGREIALRPHTLAVLLERHGEALDRFWQDHFGHGLGCLTELEAQNLCRQPSLDAIADFLAQAAVEARGRGLEVPLQHGG